MQPALAFPYNDPQGTMFHHLQAILPDLKRHFERAYICASSSTLPREGHIEQLQADDFFTIFPLNVDKQVGELFTYLYQRAADAAHPYQIVHLCHIDRLAFALEGGYRDLFLKDIESLSLSDVPLIFHRSQFAWATHPQNYRDLERMVTTVGLNLFGRELDYAWCHIAVRAGQLHEIMPLVKNPDLSMMAEMIYYLQDNIRTRDVDWLAWEDPFMLGRDAAELKRERENSLEETHKRLSYALPMVETLTRLSKVESKKREVRSNHQ